MKMKKYKNTKKQGIFMDRTKRTAGIWLGAAIVFMAAAVFGFGRAAAASQQGRLAESRLRYEKQEEAYVERARKVLDEAGLNKAGVMLEYRQGADQTRSYTLYIHHKRWEKLGEEERGRLERELESCAFEGEDCDFSCSFSG